MGNSNELNTSSSGFLSFDPIVLVRDVVKNWLLILLMAVFCGVAAFITTDVTYQPSYLTSTTMVVTTRSSINSVYSNLSSTTTLASVFTEVLNSSVLRKTVLQEAGIDAFDGSITATVIPDTNLLTLQVTASDPRTSFLVTKAIIENHESLTYEVIGRITLEILQAPAVPTGPVNSNNASRNLKIAALLGTAAGSAFLAFLSFSSNKVRSAREAREKLECRYLGEIPHEKKHKNLRRMLRRQKSGIIINNPATSFHFVETMRKLCRRIEQQMHGGKVLMITSLLENEGKSTVAVNLALTLAKKRSRVLLLECDLRKPACAMIMEKNQIQHSVRDVLAGKAELSDAFITDRATGLKMLLEAKGIRNSADLVSSSAMQSILCHARENFDIVIIDMPPMSVATDAEIMMEYADASLLVVRQNAAGTIGINRAISSLNKGKAKLIGCILNNVHSSFLSTGHSAYGYGRYGKYGQYGNYSRYGNILHHASRK